MSDIIQLLPDHVANQIAAGEVVQRPASVVKELLENAIDAGASMVKVVVKDAGKTLIQVVDNGRGMTETDARMSFERHATSKIRKTEDLFHIVTKGFRGEALASIAAVAQVELRTRVPENALGTRIRIEGSNVVEQEVDQCPAGTNFLVKNLFFNVPARRYFLKSDAIELRHIIDEFERVVLTHPDVEFHLIHNGSDLFNLPKAPIRQRIVHVFGTKYNEKLVPVEEDTDIVRVNGFIGKPEAARKTRGEQFFFVNDRFIRNSYLNHAVMTAFDGMLQSGYFPLYLLYLTIDPAQIDINIHPTKTEIKFQDERAIYAILHAAVRRALGRHNIAPTIDFDQEHAIAVQPLNTGELRPPSIKVDPTYNPFGEEKPRRTSLAGWAEQHQRPEGWQGLHAIQQELDQAAIRVPETQSRELPVWDEDMVPVQVARRYVQVETGEGIVLVDQQRAHERILFEKYHDQLQNGRGASQQLLFPEHIELLPADHALFASMTADITALGFDVEAAQGGGWNVLGVPADAHVSDVARFFDGFLEQWKNEGSDLQFLPRERTAWAMARSVAIRPGQMLTVPEMVELLQQLFATRQPWVARAGKATMVTITHSFLEQQFR